LKQAIVSGGLPNRFTVDVSIEGADPIELPVLHSTFYFGEGDYWHPFLLAPITSRKVKRLLTSLIEHDMTVIQIDAEEDNPRRRPDKLENLDLSRKGYVGVFKCALIAAGAHLGLRAKIGPKIAEATL